MHTNMQNGEISLSKLSPIEFQTYGIKHAGQFEYRVELASRIASSFGVEHLIIFDDNALTVAQSEIRNNYSIIRGSDRSLLPALWLATGFKQGATIVVYAMPNQIELREYLKIKNNFEDRLNRSIPLRIIYQGQDVLQLYENDPNEYKRLSRVCYSSLMPFTDLFHIHELKRYLNIITRNGTRSLVFPFETMKVHHCEFAIYPYLVLPDIPIMDKAKHNFFLRKHGFKDLPDLLMVLIDGTLINNYDDYLEVMEQLSASDTLHTPENVAWFAKSVVTAIDHLHYDHKHEKVFLKLDAEGSGGWSCVSPAENPLLYDWTQSVDTRIAYLINYIEENVLGDHLPTHAIVEEFVTAQIRPGDIAADYTVCGFVLDSIFYPTSVNLCGTNTRGQYFEQWTAPEPTQIDDQSIEWQQMFKIYARMVALEAGPFEYKNGIYAGDMFIDTKNEYKQRDWNIRRGGRSTPESLVMLGQPNYQLKINVSINKELSDEELLDLYTNVCDRLTQPPYHIYPYSTTYGHFGKLIKPNFLRLNILVDPQKLLDENGRKLPKNKHKMKVDDIMKEIVEDELR